MIKEIPDFDSTAMVTRIGLMSWMDDYDEIDNKYWESFYSETKQ